MDTYTTQEMKSDSDNALYTHQNKNVDKETWQLLAVILVFILVIGALIVRLSI